MEELCQYYDGCDLKMGFFLKFCSSDVLALKLGTFVTKLRRYVNIRVAG